MGEIETEKQLRKGLLGRSVQWPFLFVSVSVIELRFLKFEELELNHL